MSKAAQNQFLVSVSSVVLGYFTTKTGGKVEVDTEEDYDGGALIPDVMKSRKKYSNVAVGRTFDPLRDMAIIREHLDLIESDEMLEIHVQPCTPRKEPIAGAETIYNGTLVSYDPPEYDEQSSARSTWTLEFKVVGVA